MDESAFDRQRAEWLRKRYRLILAVLAVLVMILSALRPHLYGSTAQLLLVTASILASMLGQIWWLGRPRRWRVLEWYVGGGGLVIIVASCVTLYFAKLAEVPGYALTMLLAMLTIPSLCRLSGAWTLMHILTYATGMTIVVLVRGPVPLLGPVLLLQLVVAAMALALDASSRDRFARAELDARELLEAAHAQLGREADARTRLFVNLSHDFRTPLAIISAHAQELGERDGETAQRVARGIEAQARMLADLIEQLLELARLEAGRAPVRPCAFAVDRLARELAAQLVPAGRTITVRAAATVGALADPMHARRILYNLIANAVRQLERGASEVTVEIAGAGGVTRVDVGDDGRGVPEARRASIFERFASFDSDGSTASGIGLPLARELARLNGGDVTLVEAPRTTFRLTLPSAEPPPTSPLEPIAMPSPAPATPARASSSAEVLVVEDNPAMGELVAGALGTSWSTSRAGSFAEAAAWLDAHTPRAIVSDVLLGDASAYELLAHLRVQPRFRDVPVVILSALGEPEERVRGLSAGADDYLAKPFAVDELRARVAAAIERTSERRLAIRRMCDEFLMELHDGVTGALSRAAVLLAAADGDRSDGRVARAQLAVREALDEARTLMAVVDGACEPFGSFANELRGEVAQLCEQHELGLRFDSHGISATPLLPTTAQTLRRVTKEALTNTVKHARARGVELRLVEAEGSVQLRISDDGVGLSREHSDGRGLGLIRRRVARLGGEVTVGSAGAGGVVIGIRLPNAVPA